MNTLNLLFILLKFTNIFFYLLMKFFQYFYLNFYYLID